MSDTPSFGGRLAEAFSTTGHLCVGIDPHPFLFAEWGLPDSAAGLREFGMSVVEAAVNRVGIVKTQIAFFERHGSAGYSALEEVIASARAAGLLVIADVKRGDIGSTVDAYGQAWLTPGSTLEADAMTAIAFQGVGSLDGPHDLALKHGKGLFILAATSNVESFPIQNAVLQDGQRAGLTVAASIVKDVEIWNSAESGLGSTGVVLGATVDLAATSVDLADLRQTPILAPGFGHQGAKYSGIRSQYGVAADNVIVAASRSILGAGPGGIARAIEQQVAEVARAMAP
jgi:orotidine-5'-phosphate decarboxylase